MSIKLMSKVWEIDVTPSQQSVLMVLTDAANDDGLRCYPSAENIAWKTGYSERHTRRIMSQLRALRIIRPIGYETGGRGKAVHYRIQLEHGRQKSPFKPRRPAYDPEREPLFEELPGEDETLPQEAGYPATDVIFSAPGNPDTASDTLTKKRDTLPSETSYPDTDVSPTTSDPLRTVREGPGSASAPQRAAPQSTPTVQKIAQRGTNKQSAGAAEQKFAGPMYWLPMTTLEGYQARQSNGNFVRVLESTCQEQKVDPGAVVAGFAEYYRVNRFRHGWSDPVAALRRTLPKQISVALGANTRKPERLSNTDGIKSSAEIISGTFALEATVPPIRKPTYV